MKKCKSAVSIIGGADGSTSIFIAGRTRKKSLKERIRNCIYNDRHKNLENKIVPGTHSLHEVVDYAVKQYGASELDSESRSYIEQKNSLKESLIIQHKPELLGEMQNIQKPDYSNEEEIKEFFQKVQVRSDLISQIPDSEIHMDFHVFEVHIGDSSIELGVDYVWDIFGISYSGNKKVMKQFKNMSQELYLYYGVSEQDIREKTERYCSLVAALST